MLAERSSIYESIHESIYEKRLNSESGPAGLVHSLCVEQDSRGS